MKKLNTKYLFFIFILFPSIVFSQYKISGNIKAFYFDTTIDSCYIRLIGISPNTISDSTYSNNNGDYEFNNVPIGVYNLNVSHSLYDSDSIDLTINADSTISFQLLKSSHIYNTTLPDTLKKESSPYFILGRDMNVASTLVINKGVNVILIGRNAYFRISGQILAEGDESDSITFSSNYKDSSWQSLLDGGPSIGVSSQNMRHKFKYCKFEYLKRIGGQYVNISFKNCLFRKIIQALDLGSHLQEGNSIHFTNNKIIECESGFSCSYLDTLYFNDNFIECSTMAMYYNFTFDNDKSYSKGIKLYFRRNTIIHGSAFFCGSMFTPSDTIVSNIFPQLNFQYASDKTVFLAYNDILLLSDEKPLGIGEKVMVNVNSDSCDYYYNIFENPLIIDSVTGKIDSTSPCYKAGFNGENIGVYQGGVTEIIPSFTFNHDNLKLVNYSNPVNKNLELTFTLSKREYINISIYSINGRLVKQLLDGVKGVGEHCVNWDSNRHSSGIYYIKLSTGNNTFIRKAIVLK